MERDFGDQSGLAAERLRLWGEALMMLGQEDMTANLLETLEMGDLNRLEGLLEPTHLFQRGVCIDIVDTITKVINFGPGHFEERCQLVNRVFFEPPSDTNGRGYLMDDGRHVYVTEREWADLYAQAQNDPAWREANKPLLRALGILHCSWVLVPDDQIITISRTQKMCFATVISPYAEAPES
jgi:hypothetical protein